MASGSSPVKQLAASGPRRPTAPARRHERLRVRMARALDHVDGRALLDDAPQVHDRDPVAERPRQAEIVGDEDQRQVPAPLELHQYGQDLGPHRGVEHGDRLVADQPLRLEHERRGDCHALALAARELVRIAGQKALRLQPDVLERAPDAPVVLAARHPLDDAAARRRSWPPVDAGSASGRGPGRSSAPAGAARSGAPCRSRPRRPASRCRRWAPPGRASRGQGSISRSRTPPPLPGSRPAATPARPRRSLAPRGGAPETARPARGLPSARCRCSRRDLPRSADSIAGHSVQGAK